MKKKTTRRRKPDRDLEKVYPKGRFIAKLRRLADILEAGRPFLIQIAGERLYIPKTAVVNIEHEREGGWEEVEFQIKWRNEEEAAVAKPRRTSPKGVRRRATSSKTRGSKGR